MAAMVFGMPLLTKNMDPAELKAMQEQQAALGSGSPWEALSKALSGAAEEAPAAAAAPADRWQDGSAPAASAPSTVRARKGGARA